MNNEDNQVPQMTIADLPGEVFRKSFSRIVDPQRDPHPASVARIMSDEPDESGAAHHYRIEIEARFPAGGGDSPEVSTWDEITFQKGPIAVVGVNGIQNEQLLAIVIDRLEGFQAGPFPCEENAIALEYLYDAMSELGARTAGRIARGVEGTNTA